MQLKCSILFIDSFYPLKTNLRLIFTKSRNFISLAETVIAKPIPGKNHNIDKGGPQGNSKSRFHAGS